MALFALGKLRAHGDTVVRDHVVVVDLEVGSASYSSYDKTQLMIVTAAPSQRR